METQFIKRPARRDDWLGIRRGFACASDISAACGMNPWRTPVDLFLEKTGRVTHDEDEPTEALRLGTFLEQYAADRYTETTGRTVRNFGYMIAKGRCLGDVDRLIVPDGEKVASFREEIRTDGVLECKTSGALWDDDEIPLHYQMQGQFYLGLTGCKFVDFAVVFLAPRRDFRIYRLDRDDAVIARLFEIGEDFMRRVDADEPPSATNLADVRALYPNARPECAKDATAEVARAVSRIREIKAQTDALDEEADGLRGAVAAFMGEADTLRVGGAKAVTFRAPKPRRVTDWKGVAADLHAPAELVAAHTTETPSARRFLLCAEK